MDRQRQQDKEEVIKLEGKLQGTLKEKCELQACLAKAEKQLQEATKAREKLKIKVSQAFTGSQVLMAKGHFDVGFLFFFLQLVRISF